MQVRFRTLWLHRQSFHRASCRVLGYCWLLVMWSFGHQKLPCSGGFTHISDLALAPTGISEERIPMMLRALSRTLSVGSHFPVLAWFQRPEFGILWKASTLEHILLFENMEKHGKTWKNMEKHGKTWKNTFSKQKQNQMWLWGGFLAAPQYRFHAFEYLSDIYMYLYIYIYIYIYMSIYIHTIPTTI